jgi:hypothetical protein
MMPARLIEAARRLAAVLELENEALRAMDLRRAASLVAEKAAAIDGLTEAGEALAGPIHADVVFDARRVDSLARENRRLLERGIMAQQRVIGIIVRAAAGVGKIQPAYAATGHVARVAVPMAFSTRA